MSHYTKIQTQLVSKKHLVQALHDAGFNDVEVHETAVQLYDWLGKSRANTAEIIVRRKYLDSSSNDLGFKMGGDGCFTAVISDVDRKKLNKIWLNRLYQRYAYHVAKDTLKGQDFELIEESVDSGKTIRLTLRRMV